MNKKCAYSTILLFSMTLSQQLLACNKKETLTQLEHIYCQVKPRNANLPSFQQFRKNTTKIQHLLLKAPARKAGIALPSLQEQSTKSNSSSEQHNQTTLFLDGCKLLKEAITCKQKQYLYQRNKPNHQLPAFVFSRKNTLRLLDFTPSNASSLNNHLAEQYIHYVEKVLELGLAQAVMSFTKFTAQHKEVTKQKKRFSSRMSAMFEILKQEKKTRPFKQVKSPALPKGLELCDQLTTKIITCDNIRHTWVFTEQ